MFIVQSSFFFILHLVIYLVICLCINVCIYRPMGS
nr:MAG TPA: hypothetical protein [Caudoviricetes sp.]